MSNITVTKTEWFVASLFLFLNALVDFLTWRILPRISTRWAGLSDKQRLYMALRFGQVPAKIYCVAAPCMVLFCNDEALSMNQGNVQGYVKSTL